MNIKIILAAPASHTEDAAKTGHTVANMIYRVGRGYHLYRAHGTSNIHGGMMALETGGFSGGGPVSSLVSDVLSECRRGGFSGIVMDASGGAIKAQRSLCGLLSRALQSIGLPLFVPESLGGADDYPIIRLSTALSGGTLSGHLDDAVKRYGIKRVAIEAELVRMDFTLPSKTGAGRELSEDELDILRGGEGAHFFSPELCTNYFTYRGKDGTHFVLFDDARSMRRKLRAAEQLGIAHAFFYYPQVAGFVARL